MCDNLQELPRFASLATCLLIDSSHKSRLDVIKDIKSSNLFEEVVEASSLNDAKERIQYRRFDACLFGPTLSLTLISSFLQRMKGKSLSPECAFIAVVKRSLDTSELIEPHSIAKVPCTKQAFFESVVRGVLIANKGTAWPGVKLGDDGSIMFLDGGEWKVLRGETDVEESQVIPENFILSGDKDSIQKFCEGLSSSPKSRIDKILKTLLTNNSSDDPFVNYFMLAIQEWKSDQSFLSLKEASQNLKQKLLEFKL